MTPFWTPAKIALLERYWAEGRTAQRIGDKLGATRNAVIGKAHRLKLTPRGEPARAPVKQKIQKVKAVRPAAEPKLKGSRKTTTRSKPVPPRPIVHETVPMGDVCTATMALKANDCRWPLGDPYTDRFMYCDKKKTEKYPYCEEHCRMAYNEAGSLKYRGKVK
jgi:GcrA cell cycle regulator